MSPMSDVMACLTKIPFKESVRQKTIKYVKKMYEFYVYRDISVNSLQNESPYDVAIDMDRELDLLMNKTYTRDIDFQQDLCNLFIRLKDMHTVYVKPSCYKYYYIQPVAITAIANTITPFGLYVDLPPNPITQLYFELFPNIQNVETIQGWKLLQIDGVDAMTRIKNFAENEGFYSKDPQIRFNMALKQDWWVRDGGLVTVQGNSVKYTVQNPQTLEQQEIEYPWAAIPVQKVTSFDDMLYQCGEEYTTKSLDGNIQNTIEEKKQVENDKNYNVPYTIIQQQELKKYFEKKELNDMININANKIEYIYGCDYYELYQYGKIGIFVIPTFAPPLLLKNIYLDGVNIAFNWAYRKKNRIEKLIIDLRGNGGGYVCASWAIAKYLVPSLPKILSPMIDILHTPLTREIIGCNESYFFYPAYNVTTNKWAGDGSWFFKEPVERVRGGKTGNYSSLFLLCPERAWPRIGKIPFSFSSQDLILLTDGSCGSACGFFVHVMQQLRKAKVVVMGGIQGSNQPMNTVSFDGATVLQDTEISTVASVLSSTFKCKINIPERPKTTFRLTIANQELYPYDPVISGWEKYKTDTKLPVEFTRWPADFQLWNWDFYDNSEGFYDSVAQFFDKCAPWEHMHDPNCHDPGIPHVLVGHPCKDESFDMTRCEVYSCEAGYYLNENKTECILAPAKDPTFVPNLLEYYIVKLIPVVLIILAVVSIMIVLCFAGVGIGCYFFGKKKTQRFVPLDQPFSSAGSTQPTDDILE